MIDYHVHSRHSGDCHTPLIEACRAAIARGIREICFTDHIDFEPTDCCYGTYDYDLATLEIEEARDRFGDSLSIGFGVEVDYQDRFRPEIERFLEDKNYDYVLGSSHYVGGIILEDHERYFPGKTADQAYRPYFDNTLSAVKTGLFDTLAHLDLCKRYGVRYFGPFDWTPYREQIEAILDTIINSGMSLEINTSGLRQSPRDTYPTRDILALYSRLGGRNITIGSDAHNVKDIGAGIGVALNIAHDVGFRNIRVYNRRQPKEISITEALKCYNDIEASNK